MLLLHRPGFCVADIAWARELARGLPNARLLLANGSSGSLAMSELEQVFDAIDDLLAEGAPVMAIAALGELSGREAEVLRLLAGGCSSKEVAQQLTLGPHTVVRHVVNIYHKIDTRGRADATAYALPHGVA